VDSLGKDKMVRILSLFAIFAAMMSCGGGKYAARKEKAYLDEILPLPVAVAYLTEESGQIPDSVYMTHINYAFGRVNETFDGVRVDNPDRLHEVVDMKRQYPELRILLSIRESKDERFTQIGGDGGLRRAFSKDCARILREFNLDGIDIYWEFPDSLGLTRLLRSIRSAISKEKLLTVMSQADAARIDFHGINKYIDWVNVKAYDLADSLKHPSALFHSKRSAKLTVGESIYLHEKAGVPVNKMVIGISFYGHGSLSVPEGYNMWTMKDIPGITNHWDNVAKVPYLMNTDSVLVYGYENNGSVIEKSLWVTRWGMRGIMYWNYEGDNAHHDLSRIIKKYIKDIYRDKIRSRRSAAVADSINGIYIPKNFRECCEQLDKWTSEEMKSSLAKDGFGGLFFDMELRNIWGLWAGSRLYYYTKNEMAKVGKYTDDPDDISGYIIDLYQAYLRKKGYPK
jgi:chitinase